MAEDALREGVTKLCLALPETTCEAMGDYAGYRVKKKVFAYYLNDHHGDGIISVCCKVLPGDNAALIAAHPAAEVPYAGIHRAARLGGSAAGSSQSGLERSARADCGELPVSGVPQARRAGARVTLT